MDKPTAAELADELDAVIRCDFMPSKTIARTGRYMTPVEQPVMVMPSLLKRASDLLRSLSPAEPQGWMQEAVEEIASYCGPEINNRHTIKEMVAILSRHAPRLTEEDFAATIHRQRAWSERTFGPSPRPAGNIDHIRKELREIEADPTGLEEWIDVAMLAIDGAWRAGFTPEQIIAQYRTKLAKNEARDWPDWRTSDPNKAIEHHRLTGASNE